MAGVSHMQYDKSVKFGLYEFKTTLPLDYALSSFDVAIANGADQDLHINGGSGFPFSSGLVEHSKSCWNVVQQDSKADSFIVTTSATIVVCPLSPLEVPKPDS